MSPVPSPREETTVVGIVVAGLQQLQETVNQGFRDVNTQLSKLPETYVNRKEFDRYRDEMTLDWQQAQQRHDTDIRELCADHEKDMDDLHAHARERAAEARTFRMWLIGISATVGLGIAGLIEQYLQHLH